MEQPSECLLSVEVVARTGFWSMPLDESKSAESRKLDKFNVVQMELLMDNEAYHASR